MVLGTHPSPTAPVLSHFSLAGKTAFVTGGTRGIGLEVVRALAEAGAAVAFTFGSTPPAEAAATAQAISAANNNIPIKAYHCDVSSRASVFAAVAQAAKDFGGDIDIVVANAGVTSEVPSLDYDEDAWRKLMSVNLDGAFWTAQAGAQAMKRQWEAAGAVPGEGRGSVIFTASVSASLVNVPQTQAAYNASKAAVVHLAKSVAVEWKDWCRVNCVSPGFIETEMIGEFPPEYRDKWLAMVPGGRFCTPAELKGVYVFLASDASSYMTGSNLIIDGGYTLP